MKPKSAPQIVFLDASTIDLGDIDWRPLLKLGKLTCYPNTSAEQLAARAENADVIITNKVLMKSSGLLALKNLKLVGACATGYNHIDVTACQKAGVAVCNVPDYSTQSVAEHAILFLLTLSHRLLEHHQASLEDWSRSPHFTVLDYPFSDLQGKTLGIIGYGAIGKTVARFAKTLGMKIRVAKLPGRRYSSSLKRDSLSTVLTKSDFISLHTALTPATQGLINSESLQLMKDGACLMNLARGPIVEESAIVEALKSGKLGGYATDVLNREPPQADHPFFDKSLSGKIVLTPHVAWASREARQKLVDEMAANIQSFWRCKKRNRIA